MRTQHRTLARFLIYAKAFVIAWLLSACVVRGGGPIYGGQFGYGWGGYGGYGSYGFSPRFFDGGRYFAGGGYAGQFYQPGYYQQSAPFFGGYPGNGLAAAAGYTVPVVTPQTMYGPVQPVYAPQNAFVGQPVQGYITPNTPPGMMAVAPPQGGQVQGIVNGQWVSRCIPSGWRAPCTPVVGSGPVHVRIPGQVPGMPFGQPVYGPVPYY